MLNNTFNHAIDNSHVEESINTQFDPLKYAGLIQLRKCPGFEHRDDCKYPSTPQPGEGVMFWSCPPGYFCLRPGHKRPCSPGFYCPENTAQPIYCPARYYCDISTKKISLCPHSFYCPLGTTEPIDCRPFGICPEGSDSVSKMIVIPIFTVLVLFVTALVHIRQRTDLIRRLKHESEILQVAKISRRIQRQAGSSSSDSEPGAASRKPSARHFAYEMTKLTKVEKTFDIEFENLGLFLPSGVEIMNNVSGRLRSGRTCAIMGPSGTGKTTFVSLLTGKVKRTEGKVFVNGKQEELAKYRKLIGFVPQEDVMLRELTVRDILIHSARMRLPKTTTYQEKKRRVLEIATYLRIANVLNSRVGNIENRGISGGQRKRVNIAMELVADPSILFLDEPTSGLDSSTATELCKLLKDITRQKGLTVAAVIHSPPPNAFKQFDDLLLLGKGGRVVYHGPRDLAWEYFTKCGFECPIDDCPADFYMDIITGKVPCIHDPLFKPTDLPYLWDNFGKAFIKAAMSEATGSSTTSQEGPETEQIQVTIDSPSSTEPLLTQQPSPQVQQQTEQPPQQLQPQQHMQLPPSPLSPARPRPHRPLGLTTARHSRSLSGTPYFVPSVQINPVMSTIQYSDAKLQRSLSHLRAEARDKIKERRISAVFTEYQEESEFVVMVSRIASALKETAADVVYWLSDMFAEIVSSTIATSRFLFGIKDPIRQTPSILDVFVLSLKRAYMQIFRTPKIIITDCVLHLCCGMFTSIAAQKFTYLGALDDDICAIAPFDLRPMCDSPKDNLREIGLFFALGVLFAGVNSGTRTFGNEKLVFWRDTSSGMPTLPYFVAKFISDLPRIILASIVFCLGFVTFSSVRGLFVTLLMIALLVQVSAFAMGYVLSTVFRRENVGLIGAGFSFCFALVFSGVIPNLEDVLRPGSPFYNIQFLWNYSAPRWAIEAIWVIEAKRRPFKELHLDEPPPHMYNWDIQPAITQMLTIVFLWLLLAFMVLKCVNRSKMK